MTREAIADILEKIALLLEMQGENPFKTRAYRAGAEIVLNHPEDIPALAREGRLDGIPGLGAALRDKIATLARGETLGFWEKLKAPYPDAIFELFAVPGLGPKKVRALNDALGIAGLGALRAACESGKVAALPGFGAKTEEKLLAALRYVESARGQAHRDVATVHVEAILAFLRNLPETLQAAAAGSFRRGKEIVGDLDFLVATAGPAAVCAAFAAAPFAAEILAHGDTKVSIRLPEGLQADLRAVTNAEFPFALQYFTGSKEHNVAVRARARKAGWSLSEYGLAPLPGNPASAPALPDEESLYRFLGLEPIPPELRENLGEIEAAGAGTLPRLVALTDLRGTFHNHTTASDGSATLAEMAEAAIELGLEYLGIADHSKAAVQANGLREDRLRAQIAEIHTLNQRFARDGLAFRLLAGSEVDILKDGSLDFADDLLADLDYVVASVHNAFTLPAAEQTTRLIRAMENPHVDMLGHLTGRLLLRREPYPLDHAAILGAAARTGTVIELNANPWRLDMDWRHWRKARDLGILCAINPDAHSTRGLQHLRFGVEVARKGWLCKTDVLNTRRLADVQAFFAAPKSTRRP
jgi:DNA polymerase (family X)